MHLGSFQKMTASRDSFVQGCMYDSVPRCGVRSGIAELLVGICPALVVTKGGTGAQFPCTCILTCGEQTGFLTP